MGTTDQLPEEKVQEFVEESIENQLAFLFETSAAIVGFLCHVYGATFVDVFNRIAPNAALTAIQGEDTDGTPDHD